VNFGTGAVGLYAAYVYSYLRQGQFLQPIPGLPATVGIGTSSLGFFPAFALSLLVAAVLGALLYVLVFRPLRSAPALTKLVASIGVMITLSGVLAVQAGSVTIATAQIFPSTVFHVGDVGVQANRLLLALVICGIAIVLALGFRYTRFGLAAMATSETEKGAIVTGLSPDRIALVSWMLGAMVAATAGILIAPIVPLDPVSYTLFIVPALATAMIGGFSKLLPVVAAGLVIGMLQSEVAYLQSQHSWIPQSGVPELIVLAFVIGYLVFRGRPLPGRGAIVLRSLGRAPRPRHLLAPTVIGVAVTLALLVGTSGGDRSAIISSMIWAIVALSLVVVTGYAGQVSLGQVTLAGVGAFTVSQLTTRLGVPFPIAPLLGACAAVVIGVLLGLPALRVRGLYVAVATLSMAVFVDAFWFQNESFAGGGTNGQTGVGNPSIFGWNLGVGAGYSYPRVTFGVVCLVFLVLVTLAVAWLRTGRLGAAMLAVRANERSAAASGINVTRTKILAFAIASFIAGLGGSLLAYQQMTASEASYEPIAGLSLVAVVYVTGITSVSGGLLAGVLASGGIIYQLLNQYVSSISNWYSALTGIGLVLTMIMNPEGVVAGFHRIADKWHAGWLRRHADLAVAASIDKSSPSISTSGLMPDFVLSATRDGPLLRLEHISVNFGPIQAVRDVTFSIEPGTIVGLIGPNGAGKTTLLDAISGFSSASGSVLFEGVPLGDLNPHDRARYGIGRTFQGVDLYEDMSVAENIVVGEEAGRRRWGPAAGVAGGSLNFLTRRKRHGGHDQMLDWVCDLLSLGELRDRPVKEISHGQRQLVSVARALSGGPRLVLLDEPAAGLDSSETEWLGEHLQRVSAMGLTILLIDHDMSFVLSNCDVVHVMDLGRLIASGPPAEIQVNQRVADAYLGTGRAPKGRAIP